MAQSKAIEFLQNRALNIIFPGDEYATNLIIANIRTLESRRQLLSQLFFR